MLTRCKRELRHQFLEPSPAFAASLVDTNRRRLRVLLPLMAVVHAAHIAVFWMSPSVRASLTADVVRWRDGLVLVHAATLVPVLLLGALMWRARARSDLARVLGPVAGALFVMHGALVSGVDQLAMKSVTTFTCYAFGVAVVLLVS